MGELTVDVAFGGGFMVYVPANQLKIDILQENVPRLIQTGMKIKDKVLSSIEMAHPLIPEINNKSGCCLIFTEDARIEGNKVYSRNFTVFGKGQYDRSPTGTGTSGRLALLHAKGYSKRGHDFYQSGYHGYKL